jgi:hypothetical protein
VPTAQVVDADAGGRLGDLHGVAAFQDDALDFFVIGMT